jgi:hypothetical protein
MAQLTGSDILNLARIKAFDNDTVNGNYAVGATDALTLLNDVLLKFTMNVRGKFKYVSSSVSGFSFGVGQVEVTSLAYSTFAAQDIIAAYPTPGGTDVTGPWGKELTRISAEEIRLLINDSNNVGTTQSGNANEWTYYAVEEPAGAPGGGPWRMYVWPPINRARSVTLKTAPIVALTLISDTPDVSELDAHHVSSFLAVEMLKAQRVDDSYLQRVQSDIPKWMRDLYTGDIKEPAIKGQQARNQMLSQEA